MRAFARWAAASTWVMAVVLVASCAVGPTPPPTASPTASGTGSPTPAPTVSPTRTAIPTATPAPTLPPTATPTATPTPTRSPAPTATPTPTASSAARWIPATGATWQWQLSGRLDLSIDAAIYDLDVDETNPSTIARLHESRRHAICYVDVGTWESYRPDADAFPSSVLGNRVDGWPDERWLDIRSLDVIGPILAARLDRCARKGFDALEPDWLDAYDQDTGFPITKADSLRFARWLAKEAHARGLSIAQKNAPGLVGAIHDSFDFALVEECFAYDECAAYAPYLDAGRAVLDAEYTLAPSAFCAKAGVLGISAIRKRVELDAWRRGCP